MTLADTTLLQDFSVRFTYPVVFTRNVFAPDNRVLPSILACAFTDHPSPRVALLLETAVATAFPSLRAEAEAALATHAPSTQVALSATLPGGEAVKSDRAAGEHILHLLADAHLDRHSVVLAIGGGAFLDATGFAASLIHRGVRMIRLPTTVLSQNDGGVGVKTAINDPHGKNFLGTFAPPFAVINDLAFLDTLPNPEWRAGIAEAFKVALIKDALFFDWLCDHAHTLANRDTGAMERLVIRCAELHLHHIRDGGDPFEMGRARPLDFGHWSAHQLEAMTGYRIGHGAAVAIGIALDSFYAAQAGWVTPDDANRLINGLKTAGFQLWHEAMERRDAKGNLELCQGLERFREHLGGKLCLTMPGPLGAATEHYTMDPQRLQAAWTRLRDEQARG